jgi:hypothetical protein
MVIGTLYCLSQTNKSTVAPLRFSPVLVANGQKLKVDSHRLPTYASHRAQL